MREVLINAILEFTWDEIPFELLEKIAKESELELIQRLIDITQYYVNEHNH